MAWGASYVGAWLGAVFAVHLPGPVLMLVVTAACGALLGFTALWTWVRLMRRAPHILSHLMAPRASQEQPRVAAGD